MARICATMPVAAFLFAGSSLVADQGSGAFLGHFWTER
jgi:hypothetical protein